MVKPEQPCFLLRKAFNVAMLALQIVIAGVQIGLSYQLNGFCPNLRVVNLVHGITAILIAVSTQLIIIHKIRICHLQAFLLVSVLKFVVLLSLFVYYAQRGHHSAGTLIIVIYVLNSVQYCLEAMQIGILMTIYKRLKMPSLISSQDLTHKLSLFLFEPNNQLSQENKTVLLKEPQPISRFHTDSPYINDDLDSETEKISRLLQLKEPSYQRDFIDVNEVNMTPEMENMVSSERKKKKGGAFSSMVQHFRRTPSVRIGRKEGGLSMVDSSTGEVVMNSIQKRLYQMQQRQQHRPGETIY